MASKNIKGITIEIGGNTTKLEESLKGVNKTIYSTNSELKQLNQALKLDPKNTELLAQKQELLKRNVEATTQKLIQLKDAQRQMGEYSKLTDEKKESYRALSVEIAKTEGYLRNLNQEMKNTGSVDLSGLGEGLKKVGSIAADVLKKVTQVAAAVGAALAGVVAAGVKSYAELEQNVGGVETLFKDNADKVIDNAKRAYETAGVSANEYMAGVTSFSASLLQSLGGDTAKAADIADMAFVDMSDNANKFGTDMQAIQNAYQGFAKQNYTMLDNLKLGYGGTKTEMERLLADAEKFSGVHYDIKNLSDVYSAIHVIQNELGVTGTTAQEASSTISGSAKAMKAAFDNFLNGSGGAKDLGKTVTTFIKNVASAIGELAPDILEGITTLIQEVVPQISGILVEMLPQLLEAVQTFIQSVFDYIAENTEPIAQLVTTLLLSLVNFIIQNLPMILETGIKILLELIKGIAQALPELIPTITKVVLDMVDILLDNIDLIIDAGIELMMGLLEGIINALPDILARLPEIIIKISMAMLNMKMKLLEAGWTLLVELAKGLIKAIPEVVKQIPQIINSMIDALGEGLSKFATIGENIVKGIWDGINSFKSWIKKKIKSWVGDITDFLKDLFGISSPSKLMRDEVGVFLAEGIGVGFEKGMPSVIADVNKAMSDLNAGVQASVNPTINPTANSNPLIIQIENFNNQRETDIQALAEELEYYRKNSSLAVGGN